MKLNRTEKQRENKILDLFLSFAPHIIEKLETGKPVKPTAAEGESFAAASRFLERELHNRLEKGRKKAVTDVEREKVIAAVKENKMTPEAALAQLQISKATLYRYLKTAPVADGANKPIAENGAVAIFRRLSGDFSGEISPTELAYLKSGWQIIREHRELAVVRSRNLSDGREVLERNYDSISSEHHSVRLFEPDNLRINEKFEEQEFKTKAAAIRHYVHLGLQMEKQAKKGMSNARQPE